MSNNLPQIEIERTALDKFIDNIAFASLLVLLVLPAMAFGDLPDTIPIHFNWRGEADNFGSKYFIFLLSAIGAALYAAMKLIMKKPHLANYGTIEITEKNAEYQYRQATRLLRVMNALVMLTLAYLASGAIRAAKDGGGNLSSWFLPIMLTAFGATTVYFVYKSIWKNPV